ncbi:MAG: DUF5798 family protein [Halobacteriota archaeon]
MGLGSTTKKIQGIADTAEQMYQRMNELREQVENTQETVQTTGDSVRKLEAEVTEQRALIEAIAEELEVDLDAVTAEAHITEAESDDDADGSAVGEAADGASGDGATADGASADGEPIDTVGDGSEK